MVDDDKDTLKDEASDKKTAMNDEKKKVDEAEDKFTDSKLQSGFKSICKVSLAIDEAQFLASWESWYSELESHRDAIKSDIEGFSFEIPKASELVDPKEDPTKYSNVDTIVDDLQSFLESGDDPADFVESLRDYGFEEISFAIQYITEKTKSDETKFSSVSSGLIKSINEELIKKNREEAEKEADEKEDEIKQEVKDNEDDWE